MQMKTQLWPVCMRIGKNLLLTFTFITATVLSAPIHAQDASPDQVPPLLTDSYTQNMKVMPEPEILPDVKKLRRTHPEKVLFTHYKLARVEPDFDHFAKISPLVQRAQEIDKSAMTISEYNRIRNAFNLHDEKGIIVVHTKLMLDEYSSLQDLIVFDELNDKTYFRVPFYGEEIAIVPKDIQDFSRIRMSKPRANSMFKILGGGKELQAEFVLKPIYADRKEPFIHNDESFWLMLAEVAEIRLWAGEELAWYYRSDTYKPEDKSNLGNLYTE